jgi:hypothetical protein
VESGKWGNRDEVFEGRCISGATHGDQSDGWLDLMLSICEFGL